MSVEYKKSFLALMASHAALLTIFAVWRLVDMDEGVYWAAAKMMSRGAEVYRDFFYTQLSMMPTLFAPLADFGWTSFYMLRFTAVLSGIISFVLFYLIIGRLTDHRPTIIALLFIYAFSGLFISWHSTFKALPYCHFLSLATFFFWMKFGENKKTIFLVMAGLFLSALVNFRSVFLVVVPIYIFSVLLLSDQKKIKSLFILLVSMIPLSIPTFVRYLASPDHFIYGNYFFQINREVGGGLAQAFSNKLITFGKLLVDPQFLLVMILAIVSMSVLRKRGAFKNLRNYLTDPFGFAFLNMLMILHVYLIPNPMSRQYAEQYLVFAMILSAAGLPTAFAYFKEKLSDRIRKTALVTITAVYFLMLIPYVGIYIVGMRDYDNRFQIGEIKAITEAMSHEAGKEDTVLTEWAGYHCFTEQAPLKFTEIIGYDFGLPLTDEEYLQFNLCQGSYLNDAVINKSPKVVVTVNKTPDYLVGSLADNYDIAFSSEDVDVYRRR